jgi:hypothetical protein
MNKTTIMTLMMVLVGLVISSAVMADEYSVTAKSLEYADVKAAVQDVRSNSKDGHGTIYLPEGEADWGKNRTLRLSGGISLMGKGIDKTMIRWSHSNALIAYNDYEGKEENWDYSPMRVSGINFQASETSRGLTFNIRGVQDFRIDHIKIETRKRSAYMLSVRSSMPDQPSPRGVFDHCHFIAHEAGNYVLNTGAVLWDNENRIENLGTKNAVFMEDCHFENAYHAAASFNGAHYVMRHCTLNNTSGSLIDAHGPVFQYFSRWEPVFDLTPHDDWKPKLEGLSTATGLPIDDVSGLRSAFEKLGNIKLGPRSTVTAVRRGDALKSWDVVDFSDGKVYRIYSDPFGKVKVNQGHGGRCLEVYNNKFITENVGSGTALRPRSGGGVIFNNTITGFRYDIILVMETGSHKAAGGVYPGLDQIHDMWIWNNTQTGAMFAFPTTKNNFGGPDGKEMIKEGRDFFTRPPSKEKDDFDYTPYTYPHPLVTASSSENN